MGENSIDMDADYSASVIDGKKRLFASKENGGSYEDMSDECAQARIEWCQTHINVRTTEIAQLTTQIAKFQSVIDAINNAA